MGRRGILIYAAAAILSGLACWWFAGAGEALEALTGSLALLLRLAPLVAGGLLIAGFAQVLAPRDKIAAMLGERSGLKGLILASVAGILTPGGPFASFPLVYALYRSGADMGALVAYLTAWSVIGIHRLLVWEIPLLGLELSMLRYAASLALPIVAGLAARWLVRIGWPAVPAPTQDGPSRKEHG